MWAQFINALIGLIVMISPGVIPFTQTEANNNHIVGPIAFAIAVISLWECNRNARWLNIITGTWLVMSPIIFRFQTNAFLIDIIAGILLILLSLVKGKIEHQFGGGWRSLFID